MHQTTHRKSAFPQNFFQKDKEENAPMCTKSLSHLLAHLMASQKIVSPKPNEVFLCLTACFKLFVIIPLSQTEGNIQGPVFCTI